MKTPATLLTMLVIALGTSPLQAGTWNGTVKLGGVFLDEDGDKSTVQETYNIHEGFSLTQLRIAGTPNANSYLMIDLREINLDGRQANLLYRRPGKLKLTASLDQHRQVFDPDRNVSSDRRDWNLGAHLTPARWINLTGSMNYLTRVGDRLSYPDGTLSVLGGRYDNSLLSGRLSAEARKDGRVAAVEYRASDFNDDRNAAADRTGQVVSARIATPGMLYGKCTHMLRAAYGVSKLSSGDLDYTLANLQYTGVLSPIERLRFKYNFDAQRIDNESTGLTTDRFQNNIDATVFHRRGDVSVGYGYETNDNDITLTSYNSWRAGTNFRYDDLVTARFQYAGRVKKDQEELTLLKDVEASRFRGDLEVKPVNGLALGAGIQARERDFPDIHVNAKGLVLSGHGRYSYAGWGGITGTYSYTDDKYKDLNGRFDAISSSVTGRVDLERIKNLRLSSAITFLNVGADLDIEKSILSFEGAYAVKDDIRLEAKYNAYNYDDFVLLDRYYTANVVWFNVAYDLHTK
jgi:hypothetical protein